MCIFCKIADNQIPATLIYEDQHCLSFLDISPLTKGHCLVILKKHYNLFTQLSSEEVSHLSIALKATILKLQEQFDFSNYQILNNGGILAGQVVDHLHFHIIPIYQKDQCLTF